MLMTWRDKAFEDRGEVIETSTDPKFLLSRPTSARRVVGGQAARCKYDVLGATAPRDVNCRNSFHPSRLLVLPPATAKQQYAVSWISFAIAVLIIPPKHRCSREDGETAHGDDTDLVKVAGREDIYAPVPSSGTSLTTVASRRKPGNTKQSKTLQGRTRISSCTFSEPRLPPLPVSECARDWSGVCPSKPDVAVTIKAFFGDARWRGGRV